MRWLLIALLLAGCATAAPPASPPDPDLKTTSFPPVPGATNFLLTSEGTPYLDPESDPLAELELKQADGLYTTQLGLDWSQRLNPNNGVRTHRLVVTLGGQVDGTHTFSDNLPTAFVEVDGTPLTHVKPAELENGPHIFIRNLKASTPPRLEIALSQQAVQAIRAAKNQVSLKVQLKSDRVARSNSCFSDTGSVDNYLDCRFPYTGRNLSGAELARLKTLFQN
ncbi:hypothetical protein [Candidatus Cyanaurora vandensis]|uniref:hypothetical protein n=1 Tax=Candidatus Cyanaurora vandensis TaxID=2714958 RepID=UPI002580D917|nr:hypothetical protein [Candidatus Cyanaurora vandensis]